MLFLTACVILGAKLVTKYLFFTTIPLIFCFSSVDLHEEFLTWKNVISCWKVEFIYTSIVTAYNNDIMRSGR